MRPWTSIVGVRCEENLHALQILSFLRVRCTAFLSDDELPLNTLSRMNATCCEEEDFISFYGLTFDDMSRSVSLAALA